MISKRMMTSMLVVCIVVALAEETEGFLSFLSPSDYQRKLENDRIRTEKKVPVNLQKRSKESGLPEPLAMENMKELIKFSFPFEIRITMNPQNVQKYGELLGELLADSLSESMNDQ
ncbi:ghrelin-like [Mobula hypostoma]|uniref:ghrelin-like n=1 Tax=Mobula hypostoma TaxID=723540 RepID=UPI002FC32EF7